MKPFALFFITCTFSVSVNAQQPFTNRQQAVQQTVIKMFDALSNLDSVSFKYYCASDITFYEYGRIWNIDTLIKKAITQNQPTEFKRTNTLLFLNIHLNRRMAWVTYRLQSAITRKKTSQNLQWLETATLVKEKKSWKVKHLHSTLIQNQ